MNNLSQKICNWNSYNKSLVKRGDTIWISEEALSTWYCSTEKVKRGRSRKYSNDCIELLLTIKSLYGMTCRSVQGFFQGMVKLRGFLDMDIPDYTTLSRRASKLPVHYKLSRKRVIVSDIVVDSTGLKIYGEGEWKVRVHGKSKSRTWRKMHVAVDERTREVVEVRMTKSKASDDSVMPSLLQGKRIVGKVYADGAYTGKKSFDAIAKAKAEPMICIRGGTSIDKNPTPGTKLRNNIVRKMQEMGGRVQWKKKTDYHKRNVAETYMYRFKTLTGDKLSMRKIPNQRTEVLVKTKIINIFSTLGMPYYG